MSKALLNADHDPRAAALTALTRVLEQKADSQAALNTVLASPRLVPVDKRLCTELVYGVLRRYPQLEAFALRFWQKPDKLPAEMRLTLCMGLYESAFLQIPRRASVHWAVEHVRHRFGPGLAGVANGSLRNMLRSLKDFHNPPEDFFTDEDQRTAFLHAAPLWLVQLWNTAYGRQTALFLLEASGRNAPTGLRLNRSRPGWQELRDELLLDPESKSPPESVGPACLAFSASLPWQAKDLLRDGKAVRQSAAAYEALEALNPADLPQPIWDCCAGRGGKTLGLLEQGVPVALASDPSAARISALGEDHARLTPDAPLPVIVTAPAQNVFPCAGLPEDIRFGTVLADVPCSGLGTLARRPEIRLRRTEADLTRLLVLQREILDAAAARLQPNGVLAYLTCTLNPAENQEQVAAFLARHPGSRLESEFSTAPDSSLSEFFYAARIRMAG